MLFHNLSVGPSLLYEAIWKFKDSLWKLAHNMLVKNGGRIKRNMSYDAYCPKCQVEEDIVMHAIRDYSSVQEVWNAFIEEEDWSKCFCLGNLDWLVHNLQSIEE